MESRHQRNSVRYNISFYWERGNVTEAPRRLYNRTGMKPIGATVDYCLFESAVFARLDEDFLLS